MEIVRPPDPRDERFWPLNPRITSHLPGDDQPVRFREAWAERLAHDRRYPHLGREIPIDERCKGWAKREDA